MGQAQQKDERYDLDTHFGFGQNWSDYAQHIHQDKIQKAEDGLLKLIPLSKLKDKTFLDIGCGSGLHALAALRNGVKEAVCLDFDPKSVETTKKILTQYHAQNNYHVLQHNILDSQLPQIIENCQFDIVYSWGVLHHTGSMWQAINHATKFVKDDGLLIIAIYNKTRLCGFWKFEKKLYSNLPHWLRFPIDYLFMFVFCLIKLFLRQNPVKYIKNYAQERGMRFVNDVKDWLGGYPYESASADEIKTHLESNGFHFEKAYNVPEKKEMGILGSGCAEYVFTKNKGSNI